MDKIFNLVLNCQLKELIRFIKPTVKDGSICNSINAVDVQGNTAIHHAVILDFVDITKVLLAAGPDLTLKNNDNKIPIDLAKGECHSILINAVPTMAAWNGYETMIKKIIAEGPNFNNEIEILTERNEINHLGPVIAKITPLSAAAYRGHFNIVKMLLYAGATEQYKLARGRALVNGHIKIVKLFDAFQNEVFTQ